MKRYNVYEQRRPSRIEVRDAGTGKVIQDKCYFVANIALMGQIRVLDGQCPLAVARERFMVRHPMVHELDNLGDEIRRHA